MRRPLGSLLRRLHGLWAPPRPAPARASAAPGIEAPFVRRLDPPGLLEGVAVLGVSQWFWQFTWSNLVLLEGGGARSVVVPPRCRPHEPMLLDHLVGAAWAPATGPWTIARFREVERARRAEDAGHVDLAPLLLPGLRRLAGEGDPHGLAGAIGLLEVLARHGGDGRQELDAPSVAFGEAALGSLAELLGRRDDVDEDEASPLRWSSAQRWHDPALDGGPDEPLRRALLGEHDGLAEPGVSRVTALVERTQRSDSALGGSFSEAALAILRVHARGWSYERRPLWTEWVHGIELS